MKRVTLLTLVTLIFAFTIPTFAGDFGTAEEARAMLEKAVTELKTNKVVALGKFTKGEGDSRIATFTHSAAVPMAILLPIPPWLARA